MTEAQAEQDPEGIYIDGALYTIDDLTYREQRKLHGFVKELAEAEGLNPEGIVDDRLYVPAVITVVKQRTDDAFTLEQALDFKPKDLERPERPTKKAAARKR